MHDFTLARKRMWRYQDSNACGIAARYKHRNNSMNRPRGRIDKMADGPTETQGVSPMLKRSAAIALATVASVGIAASLSTDASAKPANGYTQVKPVQKVQSGWKVTNPNVIKMKYPNMVKVTNPNLFPKTPPKVLNPNVINAIKNNNNNSNTNINNNTNVNTNLNSSVSVASVAGAAVVGGTAVAAGPVYARSAAGGCLTKEYLQTGQVLFRDLCTSEWAVNPPAATQ
jgi:hypothetical protein